jgi:hypothetical protein
MEPNEIITLPYTQTVKPLGKVSVEFLPGGEKRVKAYFIGEHIRPQAQTGIAIEGSTAMKPAFGYPSKIGALLPQLNAPNLVSMAAKQMGSYLARKVDDDGNTTVIYWAAGPAGADVEVVGDLTAYQVEQATFAGPKKFGPQAQLLPAVRYFVERFASANWGMYVFFTQGVIDDLEAVKQYTLTLAAEIAAGRRPPLKLVLVGVGHKVDQAHLQLLDALDRQAAVDLWDYRIAAEMKDVLEIFTELGDANTLIAPRGRLLAPNGQVIADYPTGVPALVTFTLPEMAKSFQVELPEGTITQPIP